MLIHFELVGHWHIYDQNRTIDIKSGKVAKMFE